VFGLCTGAALRASRLISTLAHRYDTDATMICEFVVKCVTLIAVIHALRILGRRIGPRASGLILGLPSSTAILLLLCGRERGAAGVIEMADASLLGLIAAVALPMAYAAAVSRGWRLSSAVSAGIAAYVGVATGLACLHPAETIQRLGMACGSIVVASYVVSRIGIPAASGTHPATSRSRAALVRTIIPLAYVSIVGIVSSVAEPRWTGLMSTFPSMSTVVLAATHLEEGATSASQIARALPVANLSTAAFLAAFRFALPFFGLRWGLFCGYVAALINLAAIEWIPHLLSLWEQRCLPALPLRRQSANSRLVYRFLRRGSRVHFWAPATHRGRIRAPHRKHFAPYLEILPC
jgi:hypothetical protein